MTDRPRILVVEDDRNLAQMLAELLEPEGYAMTVAYDGQRAPHRS